MLVYKIDVLRELKEAGYNTTTLRREKLIAEASLTRIRRGLMVDPKVLDRLCELLDCQPGNIIRYVPDETK